MTQRIEGWRCYGTSPFLFKKNRSYGRPAFCQKATRQVEGTQAYGIRPWYRSEKSVEKLYVLRQRQPGFAQPAADPEPLVGGHGAVVPAPRLHHQALRRYFEGHERAALDA